MKLMRFFILSLLVHSFLGLTLYTFFVPVMNPVKPKYIEVKVIAPIPGAVEKTLGSPAAKSKVNQAGKTSGKFKLADVLPSYNFEESAMSDDESYLKNPLRDREDSPWGSGSGTFGRVKDFNFFDRLYAAVEANLNYPSVLARNSISGVIYTRIVFNESGLCDWQKTKISGRDPYLQLYILDVLKNTCEQNFKKYNQKREVTVADLAFHFELKGRETYENSKQQKLIMGNTLLFYRNVGHAMEWSVGPFKGEFPVPFMYLNVPWIQDNWDSLMGEPNPLDVFKKEFGG